MRRDNDELPIPLSHCGLFAAFYALPGNPHQLASGCVYHHASHVSVPPHATATLAHHKTYNPLQHSCKLNYILDDRCPRDAHYDHTVSHRQHTASLINGSHQLCNVLLFATLSSPSAPHTQLQARLRHFNFREASSPGGGLRNSDQHEQPWSKRWVRCCMTLLVLVGRLGRRLGSSERKLQKWLKTEQRCRIPTGD